jgi:hypothetical protein
MYGRDSANFREGAQRPLPLGLDDWFGSDAQSSSAWMLTGILQDQPTSGTAVWFVGAAGYESGGTDEETD